MRNDLKLVFSLLVETPDAHTRRTIAETLIKIIDADTITVTTVPSRKKIKINPPTVPPIPAPIRKTRKPLSAKGRANIRRGVRAAWKIRKAAAKGKA